MPKEKIVDSSDVRYKGCYGMKVKPSEIREWIKDAIVENTNRHGTKVTYNIWSVPGVGKTSIVKDLSKEKVVFHGKEENIQVVDIPLAQIEEMGDLLGLPETFVEMEREIPDTD